MEIDVGYYEVPFLWQSWVSVVPVSFSVGPFKRCDCGKWSRCLRLHKEHWVSAHFQEEA